MIERTIISFIEKAFFKGRIIILYGARQVGKTTLLKELQNKYSQYKSIFLNCDEPDIQEALTHKTSTELKAFIGDAQLVFIDEAQRVKNIGLTLKLLIDNYPQTQIIATGSSSFELSNKIVEPLTGRQFEFYLYPFSFGELCQHYSLMDLKRILSQRLIYGMYPAVVLQSDQKEQILRELTRSYLFKDVLQYQNLKHSDLLEKLLKALALQIGQEVSFNELASLLGVDKKTIESYIQLLEKTFIIFRLCPFSRNARNELRKMRKIYFYDLGIRNALINNLNPIELRTDLGSIWENFLISERKKYLHNYQQTVATYFWRNHQQQEIDYLEEKGQDLQAFEFKWQEQKWHIPNAFTQAYPTVKSALIYRDNFMDFFCKKSS